MIDSRIIQLQIIEIDYDDFVDEIKNILENELPKRIHIALYRAICEVFQVRYGHDALEEFKENNSIQFRLLHHDFFNFQTLSNPKLLKINPEFDIDKKKTVDSDSQEFSKDIRRGFYAYDEKNSAQHFAKDLVSDILLPAHLYNGKDSCGKWKIMGCLETGLHHYGGGYLKKTIQHCNNKGCRTCASNSISREARAITNRLMTFCNLKNNRKVYLKENRSRILLHIVVSIPFEEYSLYLTKEGRKKLRTKAIKHLKRFDIDGGVIIDHPYRFSEGLESARFSPHLHLIVTGWLDGQIVKELYQETAWIVSNVSTIESWSDCYGLSNYLLSHSAVFLKEESKRSSEHSVRYFGECHNKKFKVEGVLKHSITGNEQIDSVSSSRITIERKGITYPLQKVSYTHSIVDKKIKDVTNKYRECIINDNVFALSKELRHYIKPQTNSTRDNPAIPQSDPPSMEFLQMRFDYGLSQYSIVQSVYVSVILDDSLDGLCPECSIKMATLVPSFREMSEVHHGTIAKLLVDIPEDIPMPIDDVSLFDYLKNIGVSSLGMPYFDFDGMIQHDDGIYEKPGCLNDLPVGQYCNVVKSIEIQKALYQYKLNHGASMSKEERNDLVLYVKNRYSAKPLDAF